ncbi:hypothetical protein [Methylopila sp. 73B]|uniref:hypothetical protein n=1 Tax=Methylopila sp. 73B TaxID=1120792 RepID=UPI0004660FFE|nr:hypothetical protein [Methylopila sp. 73B]
MVKVVGTNGSDTLKGGSGSDALYGLSGNDDLRGGAGNDKLTGGAGDDLLRGGAGKDQFIYDARGFGRDTVADFAAGDRINLSALNVGDLATLKPYITNTVDGAKIEIAYNGSVESILLSGVSADDLTSSSFVFNASTTGLTVNGTNYSRDVLFGGSGSDKLYGFSGNDDLNGGAGDDTLVGGAGNDVIRGGAGNDVFRFDSLSGTDLIVDFKRGADVIELDNAAFTALSQGALAAGAFRLGTVATDSTDRILYDRSSGGLWYDADGDGAASAIKIATLDNHASLTASDFLIV